MTKGCRHCFWLLVSIMFQANDNVNFSTLSKIHIFLQLSRNFYKCVIILCCIHIEFSHPCCSAARQSMPRAPRIPSSNPFLLRQAKSSRVDPVRRCICPCQLVRISRLLLTALVVCLHPLLWIYQRTFRMLPQAPKCIMLTALCALQVYIMMLHIFDFCC